MLLSFAGAHFAAHSQSADQENNQRFTELQRAANADLEAGRDAQAVEEIKSALSLRPEWSEGWWNLGTLNYQNSRYAEAEAAFQNSVRLAPGFGPAWALLGLCEFELKDYSDALAHLERAHTLGLGSDQEIERVSLYHLAVLRIRAGDFDGGARLLEASFGQTPSMQIKAAFGLALLRIPLLPQEISPSREGLIEAAGEAALSANRLEALQRLVAAHPEAPMLHYAYGIELAKAGQPELALAAEQSETRISPLDPAPWIEIGRLEQQLGDSKEAASAARKAKALQTAQSSGTGSASASAAIAYYGIGADSQHVTAEDIYLGLDQWRRAMQAFAAGQYRYSIGNLASWLEKNPSDGTGWAVLGLSEFALKDYGNAQIHLERGEQLGVKGSPQSIQQAQYTLALLLIRSGEFDRAGEILSTAREGPLHDDVTFASGMALLRIAKLPEEVSESQQDLIRRAGKIALLLRASKYDDADAGFLTLIKQYPEAPFLHYAYGTALLALSQFDEAAQQMRAETAISPRSELPYIRLASIALRKHVPAEAIAPAQQAIKLKDQSAEAHYLLGRAYLELGDSGKAVDQLSLACKIAPGSPEAHFNLAKAYAKSGDAQKASQERAMFKELSDESENAKGRSGSQVYEGPRDAGEMSTSTRSPQ